MDSELQTVTVSKEVILGRGFDSLELSIGEAEVLSRKEIVFRHLFSIPKIAPDGLEYFQEYPNGWDSKTLKRPLKH